jgi:hypothetical protein
MVTNGKVMRPFMVFAIRVMPPGRRRLEMVKRAHGMHDTRSEIGAFQGGFHGALDRQPQAAPSQRAA